MWMSLYPCCHMAISQLGGLYAQQLKVETHRGTQKAPHLHLLPLQMYEIISPFLPFLWKSTCHHSPSSSRLLLALILMLPEPISMAKWRNPSSSSMAKKSARGFLSGNTPCWLPWLNSSRPLDSVVRKSKDMAPVFFVFHLGNVR